MVRQWSLLSVVLTAFVPVLFGCGSSSGPTSGKGLSDAELAKMMEGEKEAAARAPGPDVTAQKLLESLTAEPSTAGPAKDAVAQRLQVVTGTVVDRSPKAGDICYLTLDGGTHNGKVYKLKFNFAINQQEDIASVKVGDNVRIMGATGGEIKDDSLEFKECIFYPAAQTVPPPGGVRPSGGPPPLPKSK